MHQFTIEPNIFLNRVIIGFHHTGFWGKDHPENPNFLYKLKNDPHHNWTTWDLHMAQSQLEGILSVDLPAVLNNLAFNSMTVCVVPRAKAETFYRPDQKLFRTSVQNVIRKVDGCVDGTNFVVRNSNTKTTHLRYPVAGQINDGNLPYPGITRDTCTISNNVIGKDILLIDDIYTKTVNIDEDVIQAILSKGASSVIFYAIGKTILKF